MRTVFEKFAGSPAPNIFKSHSGFGDIFVCARDGTRKGGLAEGKVTKCPVDTLLARGRVLQDPDASGTDVDGS